MKISSIKSPSFKGHGAGKIKSLYMQNLAYPSQVNIYNQMRAIGRKEGFDVFMHQGNELINEDIKEEDKRGYPWNFWAQDNKILISHNDETTLICPELYSENESIEAINLAYNAKMEGGFSELTFDGGNVFLGKKDDGENYFMTSMATLYMSAGYQWLKTKNISDLTFKTVKEFFDNGELRNTHNQVIASEEELDKEISKWVDVVEQIISEDFNVKKENMIFLPSAEFHLDFAIRPLDYPYVLVNDDEELAKVVTRLETEFKNDELAQKQIQKIKTKIIERQSQYSSTDELCQELEKKGFVPIKIAGAYGRGPINFINAIVHKQGNDLVYITNSTKASSKLYERLQDIFEEDLKNKCPQIKRIYFVDGGKADNNQNTIMEYLFKYNGGIHCLCCEEMDENQ